MMTGPDAQPSPIRFGDIRDSKNFSIGHHSSNHVYQDQPAAQAEATAQLDAFLQLLAEHHAAVPDAAAAHECAAAARDELSAPSPRWRLVKAMLTGAAAAVSGVAALTDAISNILALIPH